MRMTLPRGNLKYQSALISGSCKVNTKTLQLEGGRSRTGKLLPPKFGILSFLLESVLSGRVEDAIICPVSTQYDKVIETEWVKLLHIVLASSAEAFELQIVH